MGSRRHTTNWQVITGAPCSGKTAVAAELQRRGYRVLPEAARAMIDAELDRGRTLAEIKADAAAFEHGVFRAKLDSEAALPEEALVFLDRALPDSIAYYTFEGLDPRPLIPACRRVRYRRVFLFERLPFQPDRVRAENPAAAARIEQLVCQAYRGLGYRLHRVPVLPVAERADFLLAQLRR